MTSDRTQTVPDFISKSLFETALRSGLTSSTIDIIDHQVSKGSNAGDNYCSDIYRAKITYTNGSSPKHHQISLIIKAMPFSEARGPVLEDLEVFDKEVEMYTKILPKMSELLDGEFLCAKCFYAVKEPIEIIVFEDLKELGYVMADRTSGIDEAHCKLVMNKLGRFHAASMVFAEKDIKAMNSLKFGMIRPTEKCNELIDTIFVKGLELVVELAENWKGYEDIVKKMRPVQTDVIKKLDAHCNQQIANIKVINHGDLWVNNMLFKYNNGVPVDLVFVDYQMSFYSSPGIDINYFLNTSPRLEVRKRGHDRLIESYYREFAKTLRLLSHSSHRIPLISLSEMKREISTREFFGFMASVGILPMVVMDRETAKGANLESLTDAETAVTMRKALYNNPIYVQVMQHIVKRFDECVDFGKI